jgi:5-aminopentanamidase
MPKDLKIATAQFENRSDDKKFNLAAIEALSATAAQSGADAVAFHECSVTGYSFARRLSKEQMWNLAEAIPSGESTAALAGIARRHGISVLAGLFERGGDGAVYKAHVCVDEHGVKAKYRKINPFINPHIMPGRKSRDRSDLAPRQVRRPQGSSLANEMAAGPGLRQRPLCCFLQPHRYGR